jgi:hypothetical protein
MPIASGSAVGYFLSTLIGDFMHRRIVALLSAALVLTTTACQVGTDPIQPYGTVAIDAAGEISGHIAGYAAFGRPTAAPDVFALGFVLHNDAKTDTTGYVVISRTTNGIPGSGTYDLVDHSAAIGQFNFYLSVKTSEDTWSWCIVQSGTITISSNNQYINGSFSAVTHCSESEEETTFTGEFNAPPGTVMLPA